MPSRCVLPVAYSSRVRRLTASYNFMLQRFFRTPAQAISGSPLYVLPLVQKIVAGMMERRSGIFCQINSSSRNIKIVFKSTALESPLNRTQEQRNRSSGQTSHGLTRLLFFFSICQMAENGFKTSNAEGQRL